MAGHDEAKAQQNPQPQAPMGFGVRFRIALAGQVAETSWVFRSPLWIPESDLENSLIV